MATRLKDIAQDLGLSVVTVSKVLRNHPDIADNTRQRVLQRMQELNYQPNLAARSLVTGRTMTLGLVVPDLLHPFFAVIANAITTEIRKSGYSLLIASSDEEPELEVQEIRQMLARRVDVILVASAQWSPQSFRQIEEQKVPYILLDRRLAGLEANYIGVDDEAVGALATEHLIEQGCRFVAHIRGPEVSTALGRLEGYRRTLASYNLTPLPGTSSRLAPPEITAVRTPATMPRNGCWPSSRARMASSASTTPRLWAPCARSSTPACAFRKTSPWLVAAIFPPRISCVCRFLRWIKAAKTSANRLLNWLCR